MTLGSSSSDAINARTLNLTLGSGFAAFLATAITVFNDSFKAIFGEDLSGAELARYKVTVLVAVIAAFALIAVADLLARGWTTASRTRADAQVAHYMIAAAPSNLKAKKTEGVDLGGFTVAALRLKPSQPDAVEYLLVKTGAAPEWVAGKHVSLSSG